jgi:hypothetical protein
MISLQKGHAYALENQKIVILHEILSFNKVVVYDVLWQLNKSDMNDLQVYEIGNRVNVLLYQLVA